MEGINQGNPVNSCALKYSNNDKKTIIYRIENFVFLLISLAQTQAHPQNTANKLGKSIIAIGIKKTWYVSAIKKAEPIQYKPNENQPNPKNQADKKILINEDWKFIRYSPNPIPMVNGRIEKGGSDNVAIDPAT